MEKATVTEEVIRAAIDARMTRPSQREIVYRILKSSTVADGRNFYVEVQNSGDLGMMQVADFMDDIVSVVYGMYSLE